MRADMRAELEVLAKLQLRGGHQHVIRFWGHHFGVRGGETLSALTSSRGARAFVGVGTCLRGHVLAWAWTRTERKGSVVVWTPPQGFNP